MSHNNKKCPPAVAEIYCEILRQAGQLVVDYDIIEVGGEEETQIEVFHNGERMVLCFYVDKLDKPVVH